VRHDRQSELIKRHHLRQEIQREASTPLVDQLLTERERKAIAERVRGGILRQSVWPGAGGTRRILL
jgi:Trp operon repressor